MQVRVRENQQIERINEQINNIHDRIAALEHEIHYGRTVMVEVDGVEKETIVQLTPEEIRENNKRIDTMRDTISFSNQQIDQIHRIRASREELAIEREAQRQQAEMEEQLRLQEERMREAAEKNQPEPQTEEELEQAINNETTRGLTMMSARLDHIRSLSGTRARLQAEATMLENEQDNSQSRQEQWADLREGREIVEAARLQGMALEARADAEKASQRLELAAERLQLAIESGDADRIRDAKEELGNLQEAYDHSRKFATAFGSRAAFASFVSSEVSDNPEPYNLMDGFHGRHLANLNAGVSRISTSIKSEINALYRDSQEMQEEQLRLSQIPVEEEDEETHIDVNL